MVSAVSKEYTGWNILVGIYWLDIIPTYVNSLDWCGVSVAAPSSKRGGVVMCVAAPSSKRGRGGGVCDRTL